MPGVAVLHAGALALGPRAPRQSFSSQLQPVCKQGSPSQHALLARCTPKLGKEPCPPAHASHRAVWCMESWRGRSTCRTSLLLRSLEEFCHFTGEAFIWGWLFLFFFCEGGEINYQPCFLLLPCRSEVVRNFLEWLSKTMFLNVKLMCSGSNKIQGPSMNIKLHLLPQGLVGFSEANTMGRLGVYFNFFQSFFLTAKFYFSYACPRHKCRPNLCEMAD